MLILAAAEFDGLAKDSQLAFLASVILLVGCLIYSWDEWRRRNR